MYLILYRTSWTSKYLCTASPRLNHYRGTHYNSVKQWRDTQFKKPTAEHWSAGRGGGYCPAGSSGLDSSHCTLLQPLGKDSHASTISAWLQRAAEGARLWCMCCGSRGSLPWPTAWFKPGLPPGMYIQTGSWGRKFGRKHVWTSWKRDCISVIFGQYITTTCTHIKYSKVPLYYYYGFHVEFWITVHTLSGSPLNYISVLCRTSHI